MASYPLGNFAPDAPLLAEAIAEAKLFLSRLSDIPKGLIKRIYLHWAVAGYCNTFTDYNGMVILQNGKWVLIITHNPQDNAPGLNSNSEASHTWHRNTGALGISVAGMLNGDIHNFGPDPINLHELEFLCAGAAALCVKYDIDSLGKVTEDQTHSDNNGNTVHTLGEPIILTHAECAVLDSYESERWDLGTLVPLPEGVDLTPQMRTQSGDALRARIHAYKLQLLGK